MYLRIQVLENEWQEVRIGVDLELYIGEIGGSAAKFCRDRPVIPACGGRKRSRPVDGKVGYAWDDKGKGESNAAKNRRVRHSRICVVHKNGGNTYPAQNPKMRNTTVWRVNHLRPILSAIERFPLPSEVPQLLLPPLLGHGLQLIFPHSAPSAGTVTNSTGPLGVSSSSFPRI